MIGTPVVGGLQRCDACDACGDACNAMGVWCSGNSLRGDKSPLNCSLSVMLVMHVVSGAVVPAFFDCGWALFGTANGKTKTPGRGPYSMRNRHGSSDSGTVRVVADGNTTLGRSPSFSLVLERKRLPTSACAVPPPWGGVRVHGGFLLLPGGGVYPWTAELRE